MTRYRVMGVLTALILTAGTTLAASVGGSGVSGLRKHDHSSAGQGGELLSGATLSGTTTNSGTISGGTISGATLSGTTTNSGTISGGSLSSVVINQPARVSAGLNFGGNADLYVYESAAGELGVRTGISPAFAFFTFKANGNLAIPNGGIDASGTILQSGVPVVTETGTQTITNKTINGGTVAPSALTIPSGTTLNGGALTATTGVFSGTVSSTKACASGFTRRGPNYCQRTTTTSVVAWTDATACTARTTGMSLPADAKVVLLELRFQALAGNAVGSRTNFVTFYNNSSCTGNVTSATATHTTHEQAAVAAGTVLSQSDHFVMAPLVATDTFYTIQGNAGGNGNADVLNHYVQGYFD